MTTAKKYDLSLSKQNAKMELLPENYGAYSVVYPNAPRVLVQPKLRTVFVSATEHDSSAFSN